MLGRRLPHEAMDIFETQVMSRHLDLKARKLQKIGEGFYTIGSSGHEGNAVLGKVMELTDMAFCHYRSGAFTIQRAKKLPGSSQRQLMTSLQRRTNVGLIASFCCGTIPNILTSFRSKLVS